jgi:hydroxymethylpyrimidine pyrophosphatase-like HAD family hydrolase
MIIAVDFDGTICEHRFPEIGAPVADAITWMRRWQSAGIQLVLWTVRGGEALQLAVDYCQQNGVIFDGINANVTNIFLKEFSNKIYADLYVDDRAVGCPLCKNPGSQAVVVDWNDVGPKILEWHRKLGHG